MVLEYIAGAIVVVWLLVSQWHYEEIRRINRRWREMELEHAEQDYEADAANPPDSA